MVKTKPAKDIPMRLRRRRDGSLALTDAHGAIARDGREFPPRHLFTPTWLYGEDGASVATVEGKGADRTITIELANARATYHVDEMVERADGVFVGFASTLVSAEYHEPAPIDEKVATERAAAKEA